MRLKLSVFLIFVLIILGAIATWDETSNQKNELENLESKRVFKFEKDDVYEINLEKSEEKLHLVKDSIGNWIIETPFRGVADKSAIDSFLDALVTYKFTNEIEVSPDRLKEFGVTDKSKVITFKYQKDNKKSEVKFAVGANLTEGYNTYSNIIGQSKIFVGSQYLAVLAERSGMDFRLKTFANIDVANLKNFVLSVKDFPSVKLEKQNQKFLLLEPEKFPTDQIEVQNFLKGINDLQAVGFYDDDKKYPEMGILLTLKPDFVLAWESLDKQDQLVFYKYDKSLWATRDVKKMIYRLPLESERYINKSVLIFRERKVFKGDFNQIVEVQFDQDHFFKKDKQWISRDKSYIKELLIDLEFVKTARFIDISEFRDIRNSKPIHIVELKFANEVITGKFWQMPDSILVEVSNREHLFEIPKDFFDFLDPNKKADEHIH